MLALRDFARSAVRQDRHCRCRGRVRLRGRWPAGIGTHQRRARAEGPELRYLRRRRLPRAGVDHARLVQQGERSTARRAAGLAASTNACALRLGPRQHHRRYPAAERLVGAVGHVPARAAPAASIGARRQQRRRCKHGGSRTHAMRAARCVLLELSAGAIAPARRSLGRQLGHRRRRPAGDLRSRRVLRRPRGRYRDDAAIRRLRPRVLHDLSIDVAARPGGRHAQHALQLVSRAESLQSVRRRLPEEGRRDDRSPVGRARPPTCIGCSLNLGAGPDRLRAHSGCRRCHRCQR
jgi:hypothetical protein